MNNLNIKINEVVLVTDLSENKYNQKHIESIELATKNNTPVQASEGLRIETNEREYKQEVLISGKVIGHFFVTLDSKYDILTKIFFSENPNVIVKNNIGSKEEIISNSLVC